MLPLPVVIWSGYSLANHTNSIGDNFFPFHCPWNGSENNDSLAGASWVQGAGAAGSNGRVISRDGHLYIGTDRLRLWGANLGAGAGVPSKLLADGLARVASVSGFNAIRFAMID